MRPRPKARRTSDAVTMTLLADLLTLNKVTPYGEIAKMLDDLGFVSALANVHQLMWDFKINNPDLLISAVRGVGYYVERRNKTR